MERTWRIGEVADRTGLTRRTLRHYDELGLLVPSERSWGDYRLYVEADLLRLLQIQNLKALGLSLAEIASALADPALDAAATLRSHLAHLRERISAEQVLAKRLAQLAGNDRRSWEDVLDTISLTRELGHPDPIVRLRAALTGAEGSTADLLPALVSERDPAVQEVLVWALAQQPDAAPAAIARLGDPDPNVRCLLARLLGKLGDAQAVAPLLTLLGDAHPRVVDAAAAALGRLGDPAALPALIDLLSELESPVDLPQVIAGFGAAALPGLVEAVRDADGGGGASGVSGRSGRADAASGGGVGRKQIAIETLGLVAGASMGLPADVVDAALSALGDALSDPDSEVRVAALMALSEFGDVARPVLASAADDPQLGLLARRLVDPHVG